MKALYARQSLDKKDSLSIEGQIEQCKLQLKDNEEFKVYEDKGYSGKNTSRPALNELLQAIRAGTIDTVIVYRLDRFSRNIVDFFNLYEIMNQHKCEFISVTESFDTTTVMGRAMMSILVTFAQMERENIQQRVRDNYYYRIAQDGRWAGGPAPFGFTNSRTADNKPTLLPNDQQIEIVKLIYHLYESSVNISLGQLAKILTDKGYKSNRKNGSWDSSTISKILQNSVYVQADQILYQYLELRGIKFLNNRDCWNGTTSAHIVGKRVGNSNIRKYTDLKEQSVYLTNFSGFISSRTYIAVMNRLAQNEQLTNSNQPSVLLELGGKLKCSCGYAIKSYSKSTNGRPYLDCYANRSLHSCTCKYNKFNFYEIQEKVGEAIQTQLDNLSDVLKEKREARRQKQRHIMQLEAERKNLISLASRSTLLEEATIQEIENIQRQINELHLDLQLNADILDSLQNPGLLGGDILQLDNINYSTLPLDGKKYILNLYIEKIILHEDTQSIEIIWKI